MAGVLNFFLYKNRSHTAAELNLSYNTKICRIYINNDCFF